MHLRVPIDACSNEQPDEGEHEHVLFGQLELDRRPPVLDIAPIGPRE